MIPQNAGRVVLEWMGRTNATNANPARVLGVYSVYVDPQDESLCKHLMRDGFWESWTTSWFTKVIKPGMFCVDVGANFGYVTGLMAELAGPEGLVWAFEPNSNAAFCLRQTIEINGWENVKLHQVGLGDKTEVLTLNVAEQYAGGASFVLDSPYGIDRSGEIKRDRVPVYPFDRLTLPRMPDLIKIDVEGFEPHVLRGMRQMLDQHRPLITIELLPSILEATSPGFLDELFDQWEVYNINLQGDEERISRSDINSSDWWMVVLR